MTNNQHGQVPEALIDLIDAYAETRHRCGGIYNARTEAARNAVIEALSGVQALSAAPAVPTSAKGAMWFTKKPVTIQAIQWTGENLREVITFTNNPPNTRFRHAGMAWDAYRDLVARDGLKIYTLEGKMLASPGDWIIRGVKGEHYPCKDEIFQETYAAASPTPPAEQQAAPKAAPGEPPGIQALMCVISSLHSLRDTAHFSDEEGELTNDLCTLRDWAYAQTAAFQPSPQPAPAPLIARSLAEWHEQDGNVAWWAWNGREWAGEPAWIGTPNCEDWPGYHTHWTPHPEQPVCTALAAQEDTP